MNWTVIEELKLHTVFNSVNIECLILNINTVSLGLLNLYYIRFLWTYQINRVSTTMLEFPYISDALKGQRVCVLLLQDKVTHSLNYPFLWVEGYVTWVYSWHINWILTLYHLFLIWSWMITQPGKRAAKLLCQTLGITTQFHEVIILETFIWRGMILKSLIILFM